VIASAVTEGITSKAERVDLADSAASTFEPSASGSAAALSKKKT
jgi:hypothetical protein